ncbi:MAG: hypothetical protein NTZ14_14805 [Hyphomicrobiales bacterium]|nr:hypothetical protein [Hyphomicrobiales bacterium]
MTEANLAITPRQGPRQIAALLLRSAGLAVARTIIAALAQLGWRTGAALSGVLAIGWMASAVPALIEAGAALDTGSVANAAPSVSHTGALPAGHLSGTDLAPRPDWVAVSRPVSLFNLGLADLEGQPIRLQARRDQGSGLREDMFQSGDMSGSGPLLHLAMRRISSDMRGSLFVDMTRLASEAGLAVTRSSQPIGLASKFGPVETADIMLAGAGRQAGHERHCIAFRHRADGAAFSFDGWFCGSAMRAADRQQLTCLFDKLQLLGAGDDRPLRAYFAKAELARQNGCVAPKLQAAGRRTSWLDPDQSAPRLKKTGA